MEITNLSSRYTALCSTRKSAKLPCRPIMRCVPQISWPSPSRSTPDVWFVQVANPTGSCTCLNAIRVNWKVLPERTMRTILVQSNKYDVIKRNRTIIVKLNLIDSQIACNPNDVNQIALAGHGLIRILACTNFNWRQYGYSKGDQWNLTCATWLSQDRLICGSVDGRLLVLDSGELKAIFFAGDLPSINLKIKDE